MIVGMVPRTLELHPSTLKRLERLSPVSQRVSCGTESGGRKIKALSVPKLCPENVATARRSGHHIGFAASPKTLRQKGSLISAANLLRIHGGWFVAYADTGPKLRSGRSVR
jgi:hypothetical protein